MYILLVITILSGIWFVCVFFYDYAPLNSREFSCSHTHYPRAYPEVNEIMAKLTWFCVLSLAVYSAAVNPGFRIEISAKGFDYGEL